MGIQLKLSEQLSSFTEKHVYVYYVSRGRSETNNNNPQAKGEEIHQFLLSLRQLAGQSQSCCVWPISAVQ